MFQCQPTKGGPIKIYVSGSYAQQERLRRTAEFLLAQGHIVTSTWLNEKNKPFHLNQHEWYHALAVKDLVDLAAADCIIMDTEGVSTTGGRYVEWGFALGRYNMLKIVVGRKEEGVFTTLADHNFKGWDEVLDYLKEYHTDDVQRNAEAG